jgi:hypothetical protein
MTAFNGPITKDEIKSVSEVQGLVASSAAFKSAYPPVAPIPTQQGPSGLRFDFNLGCRLLVPDGKWLVRLRDLDTGNILYETTTGGSNVSSSKRYFIRFGIEVWDGEERVLSHHYDATGREVLIQFPVCREVPAEASVRADLRHVGPDHPAVPGRLSAHHLRHP